MELIAFDPDLSTQGKPESKQGVSKVETGNAGDIARAVTELLQHKVLTHTFGIHGEWEVRTTFVANRQAWRYHSNVFAHGKEARQDFPPIGVDQTRRLRHVEAVTEAMVTAFAREAVEVHFARCASVAEYSLMASIFSQPPRRLQSLKKVALVLLSVAILLTAYWWWRDINGVLFERAEWQPLPQNMRWQSLQVAYDHPAGEPFVFPLPTLEGIPKGLPVEITLVGSGDEPRWLELDRERLSIRGTAPATVEDQTYRLSVRARTEHGSDSQLFIVLTITGQADRMTPTPQLRAHWTW